MPLPVVSNTDSLATHSSPQVSESYRTHRRFDRAARLFGEPGLHHLMGARVLVFGVGGVGSFAAESLARSAVGTIELIDFDDVCVTNTNRQLHAMKGNIGKPKVDIMAERLSLVHPTGNMIPRQMFYQKENSDALLEGKIDFVVDAIDNITAKAHLIATCVERKIPIVSSMGAAARMDPTKIEITDLADTHQDPFARAVRSILREQYGFSDKKKYGVQAVFSTETPLAPQELKYDEGKGFVCVCPNNNNGLHSCEKRSRIDGSASFVTGSFGLTCASVVVRGLIKHANAS